MNLTKLSPKEAVELLKALLYETYPSGEDREIPHLSCWDQEVQETPRHKPYIVLDIKESWVQVENHDYESFGITSSGGKSRNIQSIIFHEDKVVLPEPFSFYFKEDGARQFGPPSELVVGMVFAEIQRVLSEHLELTPVS